MKPFVRHRGVVALLPRANDDTDRARQQFELGQMHADLGHFEQALEAFSEAYRIKPIPALLFNLAVKLSI